MGTNKDFGTITANAGTIIGDTSASFKTKLGVFANNAYSDIIERLKSFNLFEGYRSFTATCTAGTSDYPVPSDYDKAVTVLDVTNGRQLDVISEEEFIQKFARYTTIPGAPICMIQKANSCVRAQPSASTTLRIVSSSSSDTTQSVKFRAISGSAEFYDSISLNGTTSAACTASYDYYLQIGKDGTTDGAVTCSFVTGGTVAAVISPEQTEARYKRVGFYYVPAGSYEMDIRYVRQVAPMTQTDDFPIIDVADAIELKATADGWRAKRQYGWAADHETLYERWVDRYIQSRISGMVHQADVTPYPRDTGNIWDWRG